MELTDDVIRDYMGRCIELGKKCRGLVGVPHVGSLVLSSDGTVVGEGYRTFLDGTSYLMHAERIALDQADVSARSGTLFTTLEPCKRYKKDRVRNVFSPCAELVLERGITRVVFGLRDTSPFGNGGQYLENHGVEIVRYDGLNSIIEYELMTSTRKKQGFI